MQLEHLPAWVHRELDKATKKCVWRTKGGGRGVHLLKWDTLFLLKKQGGANLKHAKDMNQALLAMMAWRLLLRANSPWCSVLIAKYGIKEEDGAHFKGTTESL